MGLALVQGGQATAYKESESHKFSLECVDTESCAYQLTYTAIKDGAFMLHVWSDEYNEKAECFDRHPFSGSPFQMVVAAGAASANKSFCEGWSKESRAVDKHGKAIDQGKDQIIAGDTVTFRCGVCDGLGNQTTVDEKALDVRLLFPDGTVHSVKDNPTSLKLVTQIKGGITSYDVRHEATNAGRHEMHIALNGQPISGTPVFFDVVAAPPEVKTARLTPPADSALYSSTAEERRNYAVVLTTFDRFGNPIRHGGLAVAARLMLVKTGVHDLTTLVPNNHSVDVVDNEDGTYEILVSLIKIVATVKCIVNMDKNIPAGGGDLPAVQLTFVPSPSGSLHGSEAMAATDDAEEAAAEASIDVDGSSGGAAAAAIAGAGAGARAGAAAGGAGVERLKAAGNEMLTLMGAGAEGTRPKGVPSLAVEAFADAGKAAARKKGR